MEKTIAHLVLKSKINSFAPHSHIELRYNNS